MTVAVADLRGAFPEFTQALYPDAQVQFWLGQAYLQISAARFGASMDLAVMLFTAHNLVLSRQAAAGVASGGAGGLSAGVVSSKAVGPVSKSYDTSVGLVDGAGTWNLTLYGQRYAQLLSQLGAGPFYAPGASRSYGSPYGAYTGGGWPYRTNA